MHTVEKIGGTSMSDYASVRDNIILGQRNKNELYNRIFVVSAYGGITNRLLEHKKSGQAGVYSLFASSIKINTLYFLINWRSSFRFVLA